MGCSPRRSVCREGCCATEMPQLPSCNGGPCLLRAFHSVPLPGSSQLQSAFLFNLHVPFNPFDKAAVNPLRGVPVARPISVLSFTPATPSRAPFVLVIYGLTSKTL